jgi:tRNA pseudouridine38-40 synthase
VHSVRLVVAGRTDAGVHAIGQVCHCDVPQTALLETPGRTTRSPASALLIRLAGVLPADIRVSAVSQAPAGFDARFSAVQRRYSYLVSDDPSGVPPLRRRDVLWSRSPLDVDAMDDAAGRLVGLHDFAAFCKKREGATTVRTLLTYSWSRSASDGLVVGRVEADAFCHSMVRALVGAVLPIGQGKQGPEWPLAVLTAGVRSSGVAVVPPHGLVLEEVTYPHDDELALRAQQSRAVRTLP